MIEMEEMKGKIKEEGGERKCRMIVDKCDGYWAFWFLLLIR